MNSIWKRKQKQKIKTKKAMTKKIILFISPIIVLVEIYLFSWIAEMLRQPSDVAVIAGVILVCAALVGNFYLIKFINKQFKQTKK